MNEFEIAVLSVFEPLKFYCNIFVEAACGKARHSCYNFCSLYARALVHACVCACVHPSGFSGP